MDMPYTQRLDGGAKYQIPQALQPVQPKVAMPPSAALIAPQGGATLGQQGQAALNQSAPLQHEGVAPVAGLVKNALERGSAEAVQHLVSKGMTTEEASVAVAKAMEDPNYEFRPSNPATVVALERTAKEATPSPGKNKIVSRLEKDGVLAKTSEDGEEEGHSWTDKAKSVLHSVFPTGKGAAGPAGEQLAEARRRPGYNPKVDEHPAAAAVTGVVEANNVDLNDPKSVDNPVGNPDIIRIEYPDGTAEYADKKNLTDKQRAFLEGKAKKGGAKITPVTKPTKKMVEDANQKVPPEADTDEGVETGVKGVLEDHSTWNNSMDILSKSLFNYAIGYAQSGGDQRAAAGAAIQGGVGQWEINKRKPKIPQLQKAGLTDAQIDKYVQSGALSAQSEAQLAKYTEAQRVANGGPGAAGKGDKPLSAQQASAERTLTGHQNFLDQSKVFEKETGDSVDHTLMGMGNTTIQNQKDSKNFLDHPISFMYQHAVTSKAERRALDIATAWLEGPLRDATGAQIAKDELGQYFSSYFPNSDDTAESAAAKARARERVAESARVIRSSGTNLTKVQAQNLASKLADSAYTGIREGEKGKLLLVRADGKTEPL